jgi:hypothetical protein
MPAAGDEIVAADITELEDYTTGKPIGRMQQTVAQSIPDNTQTALTFTTEDIDTHNFHDTGVNNSRITPTVAGYYRFDYCFYIGLMTTPVGADVMIRKNGSVVNFPSGDRIVGSASLELSMSGWTYLLMNGTTDYVEVMGYQNSAGAVNTSVSGRLASFCTWELIRPA